jgi:RNA polymerase sigma-70 factor (ECF subfamily)
MNPSLQTQAEADWADDELARRIAAKDGRAFEVLMRRHNRTLFRLARSILKNDEEAEDVLQDAYVAAYRAIASFKGDARLSTWLGRIVINEAYGRLRKRKRAAVVMSIDAEEWDHLEAEADMSDRTVERPDVAASRAELRRLLEAKIDALPEQFRTVFMLRDVEELTVEETAELLGVPSATVRTRAFRARALLRAALAEEFDAAAVSAFGFAGARCDRIVAAVLSRIAADEPR